MRHTHDREIDGQRWRVSEFSATEGLRLLARLTSLCGESVAKAIGALPRDGSILDAQVDFALLADAIAGLAARLDEDSVVELVRRLLACTVVEGDNAGERFDRVFQGRYMTLFKVLAFVVEVNYKVPLSDWMQAASPTAGADAIKATGT